MDRTKLPSRPEISKENYRVSYLNFRGLTPFGLCSVVNLVAHHVFVLHDGKKLFYDVNELS